MEENKTEPNTKKSHKKVIMWSIIGVSVILILLIISTGFAILNINNKGMMPGVTISGVDVKGLTKDQAAQKVMDTLNKNINKEITLQSGDFTYTVDGNKINAKYDVQKAIDDAYNVGRSSNIFVNNFDILKTRISGKSFTADFSYDSDALTGVLSDVAAKVPNAVVQSSYSIDGNQLIITKGQTGNTIDMDSTKEAILNKINNNDGSTVELKLVQEEPKAIDIDQIHSEVYKEAKDAYYTKNPFQIFPQVNGVDFDVNAAKQQLAEDKPEYTINLTITVPKVTTAQIGTEAFPDLLGSFTTNYVTSNVDRTTNLKLAAGKINGQIVLPGATFSYNQTVGERTIAGGYKEAPGYSNGAVEPTLGGGICQMSSTLYDAAVYANLDIVERHNHSFLTSYTTAGRDATVVYGALDFKFKNTRQYPIMIKASVNNGVAKVDIYGIKESIEYQVEMSTTMLSYIPYQVTYQDSSALAAGQQVVKQNGMNGCTSITYKIVKLNGAQVSSTVLSKDTYSAMNKIVQRGASAPAPAPEDTTTSATPDDSQQEILQPESVTTTDSSGDSSDGTNGGQ